MVRYKLNPIVLAVTASLVAPIPMAFAQNADKNIETISIVSRSPTPRSVDDSPVPVDVFSGEQFNALGNAADITDNLKSLVPSYTATPATGDGSAFVRPTSLRGMAPDQTLVLVNGKRRHRSALVHFFAPAAGNGAHGADIGMIPSIALKSVEVLRDGAAAQYGSDAIAGVMNFRIKDNDEGGEVILQYGQYYAGEDSIKFAANKGFAFGNDGFVNVSLEHTDNDALSRGIQRPDAQALIDAGITGVGADSPFDDAPLAQTWGRPETSGTRLFINAGMKLAEDANLYLHSNYGDTEGTYRFFYRPGNTDAAAELADPAGNPGGLHSSLATLFEDFGYRGDLLLTGYTPFLDGDQKDYSLVVGVEGQFSNGVNYDFSGSYGLNELDYFLHNTTNPSLGLGGDGEPLQRNFDVGGYEQEETNFNADFNMPLGLDMSLAYGVEWREETYTVNPGEENSYIGAGSNGLGGFRPEDSGEFSRRNWGAYVEVDHDLSDNWLMQYALRFEDFSDFGNTTNWKVATRYNITDDFIFRAAVSTGFHAPTPGQANVRTTITTFDGATGRQVEEGLVPSTSELARRAGGTELKEEESDNYSIGFTARFGDNTSLTLDFYQIEVDDRIYRTGDIQVPISDEQGAPETTISFYTNALDVEHKGFDLVLTSEYDWSSSVSTDFSFAFNYNEVEIVGQREVGGEFPVNAATIEDIENNFPNERFVLSALTHIGEKWSYLVRANFYGEHYDERGTIDAEVQPSAEIDSIVYVDMEVNYQYNDNWTISLGATNIFDSFVDEIGEDFSNRLGVGLQYPRRSAANYEGGSWYLRSSYKF
ncbi:TonB-dependent receptor plug domain-containing protein [Alteromonas sp. a30]|uniref:TonB-dependent receptor plug domain-containing protein n=1 Tax=Alteromonas sp. a30 TaxID=2730917 RepID=UPI00227DE651|nr:TonB-dependent receptor [Alteromonas sp. a30]MCY7297054.1 TonB-dependent receptor [Alteromonas sp. a30]